jgi:hypothetical protein
VLPLLLPLWVNLHGGFLAGLGAVGLALLLRAWQALVRPGRRSGALFRDLAPLALTLAACGLGSLVNPLGWRLWPYLVTELGYPDNRKYIIEWEPLSFAPHSLWTTLLMAALLLLGVTFAGVAMVRGKRAGGLPAWAWLLSCAPLALMAYGSNRHAPISTLWAVPVVGLLAGAAVEGSEERTVWQVAALLLGLATVPALLTAAVIANDPSPRIRVPPTARAPHSLSALFKVNDLRGNLYAPLWWGSSLTWELHPDVLVALDGRNVTLFAPEDVTANLLFYHEQDKADLGAPLKYPTDFLALPADAPVLPRLRGDARWRALYKDKEVVLFGRADRAPVTLRRPQGGGAPQYLGE